MDSVYWTYLALSVTANLVGIWLIIGLRERDKGFRTTIQQMLRLLELRRQQVERLLQDMENDNERGYTDDYARTPQEDQRAGKDQVLSEDEALQPPNPSPLY